MSKVSATTARKRLRLFYEWFLKQQSRATGVYVQNPAFWLRTEDGTKLISEAGAQLFKE